MAFFGITRYITMTYVVFTGVRLRELMRIRYIGLRRARKILIRITIYIILRVRTCMFTYIAA